jgi:hypothetical protein
LAKPGVTVDNGSSSLPQIDKTLDEKHLKPLSLAGDKHRWRLLTIVVLKAFRIL